MKLESRGIKIKLPYSLNQLLFFNITTTKHSIASTDNTKESTYIKITMDAA